MELSVHAYGVAKKGNTPDEYEDAYSYSLADRRFALADGATESSFADRWAQSLVRQFSQSPPNFSGADRREFSEWLEPLQHQWRAGIPWDRLPWYAEEKARRGAFATLLAVEFLPHAAAAERAPADRRALPFWKRLLNLNFASRKRPRPPHWHALAIGDTCLFQVRNRQLITAFPLTQARQFNTRPVLLSSNPSSNRRGLDFLRVTEGFCEGDDLFILASDALAQWILAAHENQQDPWSSLEALRSQKAFLAFVETNRREGDLKNDDTTLLHFRWPSAS